MPFSVQPGPCSCFSFFGGWHQKSWVSRLKLQSPKAKRSHMFAFRKEFLKSFFRFKTEKVLWTSRGLDRIQRHQSVLQCFTETRKPRISRVWFFDFAGALAWSGSRWHGRWVWPGQTDLSCRQFEEQCFVLVLPQWLVPCAARAVWLPTKDLHRGHPLLSHAQWILSFKWIWIPFILTRSVLTTSWMACTGRSSPAVSKVVSWTFFCCRIMAKPSRGRPGLHA